MTSRHFFAGAVFLPVIMAAIGFLVANLSFFVALLFFGGVPYLPVAAALVPLIIRARSLRALALLSVATPLTYGVALALYGMIAFGLPEMHSAATLYLSSGFQLFGYGAAVSGMFVLAAWLLWAMGVNLRFVEIEFPP